MISKLLPLLLCSTLPGALAASRIGTGAALAVAGGVRVADPAPRCPEDDPAGLSRTVFAGSEHGVAGQFCQEQPDSGDPGAHRDYAVRLEWTPKNGPQGCTKTCADAYRWIATGECGRHGRRSDEMASEGSWTDGCGAYAWTITPPREKEPEPVKGGTTTLSREKETKPKRAGYLKCYAESGFPGHKKVPKGDQGLKEAVSWACDRLYELADLRPGQRWDNSDYRGGKSPYKLSVEWPANCVVEGLAEQRVYPTAPLMGWSLSWHLEGNRRYCKTYEWHGIPTDCSKGSGGRPGNNGVGREREFGCVKVKYSL
ncbi:hypothetical protein LX36DRAFT_715085 [Colletotrichum falcatum]|nr:hypothetical protein LX36DRAFT_715085 [Colletotrichum falcatum]